MKKYSLFLLLTIVLASCMSKKQEMTSTEPSNKVPFVWENANIYFLLTDRFNNGDTSNDLNFNRTKETSKLRGFEGGDIIGITKKLKKVISLI